LNIIRVNITRERLVNESIPYEEVETYTTKEPEIIELCFEKKFDWDYEWIGRMMTKKVIFLPISNL